MALRIMATSDLHGNLEGLDSKGAAVYEPTWVEMCSNGGNYEDEADYCNAEAAKRR